MQTNTPRVRHTLGFIGLWLAGSCRDFHYNAPPPFESAGAFGTAGTTDFGRNDASKGGAPGFGTAGSGTTGALRGGQAAHGIGSNNGDMSGQESGGGEGGALQNGNHQIGEVSGSDTGVPAIGGSPGSPQGYPGEAGHKDASAGGAGEAAAGLGSSGAGAGGADSTPKLRPEWSGLLDSYGIRGTDVATALRSPLTLDLFAISSDGEVTLHTFYDEWSPTQVLPKPPGVILSAVAAVSINEGLDVIATGPDHKLYYNYAESTLDTPEFVGWLTVPGVLTSGEPNSLAAVTTGDGIFHTFWITEDGNVGHGWGRDFSSWDAVESGDDADTFFLQPTTRPHCLNAVSTAPTRLDVVLDGPAAPGLQHLWFDAEAGDWGYLDSPHRELLPCIKLNPSPGPFDGSLSGFAAVASDLGSFDLFVTEQASVGHSSVYHTSFSPALGWNGDDAQVWFAPLDLEFDTPSNVVDALVWRGSEQRKDLFGTLNDGSSSIWQAFYH